MADAECSEAFPYRPVSLAELQAVASGSPAVLPYLLAVTFNYDVKQGGFAQLLYNLGGEFLADVEDMLIAAGAGSAHEYWVRAVTICLEDKPAYFRFLASEYASANAVKHALQLLSVEFLQRQANFAEETSAFLASCPRVYLSASKGTPDATES
jgi:hypothetical protein